MVAAERWHEFPQSEIPGVNEYYEYVWETQGFPDREVYCSMPITSANFGGLMPELSRTLGEDDFARKKRQIIRMNARLNEGFTRLLQGVPGFEEVTFTLPHKIGARHGWGELEFMAFWMMRFVRMSPEKGTEFSEDIFSGVVVDREVFNNYGASRSDREREYGKLVGFYGEFVGREGNDRSMIEAMVMLPGHQKSLGCQIEKQAAQQLGIKVYELVFDRHHPTYDTTWPINTYGWSALARSNVVTEIPTIENGGESLVVLRECGN